MTQSIGQWCVSDYVLVTLWEELASLVYILLDFWVIIPALFICRVGQHCRKKQCVVLKRLGQLKRCHNPEDKKIFFFS
jgi:hypothetical protein